MAENKIENKDLFGKDLFKGKIQKNAKTLINLLDELEKKIVEVAKSQKALVSVETGKTVKSINNVTKATKTLSDAEEKAQKIRKDREKLQKSLNVLNADSVDANEELKVQISEQRKANKQAAKEALGLVSVYQKQSKELNELRKRYKDVRLEEGKNSKAAKELRKEIEELDTTLKEVDAEAGQFQRSVGNYEKVNEGAKRSFASLSGFILGAFAASFTKSRDTARELQGGIERVTNVIRNLGVAIISFATNKAFPKLENVFLSLKKTFLEVKNSFTFGDASDKLGKEIEELDKKIKINQTTINNSADSFSNLADKISETDENIQERLKRLDTLADLTAILSQEILELTGKEAQLEVQIGNSTVTFRERDKLITQLTETQRERLGIENKLAELELENALISIKNDLIRRDLGDQFNRQSVKTLEFLKNKNLADAIGAENLASLVAATSKLTLLEQQRIQQGLESNKERLENARDLFEQELDFTLDIGDRQKSVRERIASDEKKTIKERAAAIREAKDILEDSFKEQIKLTEDFVAKSIELNSKVSGEEALRQVKELNLEKIVGLEDEREVRKQLFGAGIADEITQNRIREIIIERKSAIQDIIEAQTDLNDAVEEELDLKAEIAAQEKAINENSLEGFENLEEEKTEIAIENLKRRLENLKEGSIEELRTQKELNDLLIDQKKSYLDDQNELLKAQAEKEKELRNLVIDVANDLITKQFEKNIDQIEKSLDNSEKRVAQLQDKANQSRLSAEESISFEIKQQAELERKRENERKNAIRTQALFTVLESYNKNDGDLGKTITDMAAVKALANSLTGFYFGTDDTGSDGKLKDQYGKITGYTHENEMVFNAKEKVRMGNKSRKEVIDIVNNHDSGLISNEILYQKRELLSERSIKIDNSKVVKKIDEGNRLLKSMHNDKDLIDVDSLRNVLKHTKKRGNKKVVTISKLHK